MSYSGGVEQERRLGSGRRLRREEEMREDSKEGRDGEEGGGDRGGRGKERRGEEREVGRWREGRRSGKEEEG